MRVMFTVVAAILSWSVIATAADELTRESALAQLRDAHTQVRRDAVTRLAEIGTMDDVTPLLLLLRDPDEDTRELAQAAIWSIWSRSGDAEIDKLFQIGVAQMEAGELKEAIDTFTQVIAKKPEFAEGWNKRATVYFLAGDMRHSLADCDEVMKRNPHHWGALAGYAQIYTHLEYYERALEYSRKALEVNPNLEGVRRNIPILEHVIEQKRRQMI
jgi:tetratricopeptide (TPR) repeat protein